MVRPGSTDNGFTPTPLQHLGLGQRCCTFGPWTVRFSFCVPFLSVTSWYPSTDLDQDDVRNPRNPHREERSHASESVTVGPLILPSRVNKRSGYMCAITCDRVFKYIREIVPAWQMRAIPTVLNNNEQYDCYVYKQ